jgi:hypothetical protein
MVSASENDYGIAPAYCYTSDCYSSLSISGSTATCTSSATGYYGETTKISVYQVCSGIRVKVMLLGLTADIQEPSMLFRKATQSISAMTVLFP